jgi:thiol-disulfide isomerase/thioredoxin
MLTKRRNSFLIVLLLFSAFTFAQKRPVVYKVGDLLNRIHNNSDTIYVVNFWATWCKPCVEELPDFEKFYRQNKPAIVKILLVSLDFKEDIDKKVIPFLEKNNYSSEVVLLDEVSGYEFINKINVKWGGAIPATYFTTKNKKKEEFIEKKINLETLNSTLMGFLK